MSKLKDKIDHKSILNNVAEIICVIDNEKIYRWMNEAGKNFFGDNALGKEISYYLSDQHEVYKNIQSLLKDKNKVFCITNWQTRKDGEKRLFSWWRKILKDSEGKVVGELLTGRDVTERKMLEQGKDKLISKLQKRNSELDALYAFSKLVQKSNISINQICESTLEIIRNGLSYPHFAECKILINNDFFQTLKFKKTNWGITKSLKVGEHGSGLIEVYYTKKLPEVYSGPFNKEEVNLIDALSDSLSKTIERLESAKEIIEERKKLKEANITLKNVLSRLEEEKSVIKENVALNVEKNIFPILEEMEKSPTHQKSEVELLKNNLKNISSEFYRKLVNLKYNLTPSEIEICRLIKAGYLSKKIADALSISYSTVTTHKKNIRRKLQISNTKVNLRTYLNDII